MPLGNRLQALSNALDGMLNDATLGDEEVAFALEHLINQVEKLLGVIGSRILLSGTETEAELDLREDGILAGLGRIPERRGGV